MRRFVIVPLVAAGITALGATAAVAAPPEVQQRSCEAGGGAFAKDHGTKSCTTTAVQTFTTVPAPTPILLQQTAGLVVRLTGTAYEVETVQTTTVETQKGNGEVTTTEQPDLLSAGYVYESCQLEETFLGVTDVRTVSTDVCENPAAYRGVLY